MLWYEVATSHRNHGGGVGQPFPVLPCMIKAGQPRLSFIDIWLHSMGELDQYASLPLRPARRWLFSIAIHGGGEDTVLEAPIWLVIINQIPLLLFRHVIIIIGDAADCQRHQILVSELLVATFQVHLRYLLDGHQASVGECPLVDNPNPPCSMRFL